MLQEAGPNSELDLQPELMERLLVMNRRVIEGVQTHDAQAPLRLFPPEDGRNIRGFVSDFQGDINTVPVNRIMLDSLYKEIGATEVVSSRQTHDQHSKTVYDARVFAVPPQIEGGRVIWISETRASREAAGSITAWENTKVHAHIWSPERD